MEILKSIQEVKQYVQKIKKEGNTVGLVPTMGYFHEGHLELMRRARAKGHQVLVTLFVNPAQFGPNEDFDTYPRDFERDFKLAREVGVSAIFVPAMEEIYPEGYNTYVKVEGMSEVMCGYYRPNFFRGVATVVLKLFNITTPDEAFFGQKDGQQAIIVKKMVKDLNLDIPIEVVPTVREEDGLAMSSRNVYLNPKERQAASIINKSLKLIEEMVHKGERNAGRLIEAFKNNINTEPLAQLQYVEIRYTSNLQPVEELNDEAMMATAVIIGSARLIDNIVLKI